MKHLRGQSCAKRTWARRLGGIGILALAPLLLFLLAMLVSAQAQAPSPVALPGLQLEPNLLKKDVDPRPPVGQASQSKAVPEIERPSPSEPLPTLGDHWGAVGEPTVLRLPSTAVLPRRPLQLQPGGTLLFDGFEGAFPGSTWTLEDWSDDGFDRTWGLDDYQSHSGSNAVWASAGGADGLDPEQYYYPANLDSWMIAGPFSLADTSLAYLGFYVWYDTELLSDYVAVGVSTDGETFTGWRWDGWSGGWAHYEFDLGEYRDAPEVWIAFQFHSDASDLLLHEGAWIDDVTLWFEEAAEDSALIENGGFETGSLGPWQNRGTAASVSSDSAHGGTYAAHLGGGNGVQDELYQQVRVPASARTADIQFWMKMTGQETIPGSDYLCATVYAALPPDPGSDPGVADLGCVDGVYRTGGWQEVSFALSGDELDAVRGQDVFLHFYLGTDSSLPTEVWLDDVQFWARAGGGDALEPNDSPETATPLVSAEGVFDLTIDPAGDEDWFSIVGTEGQSLAADVDAQVDGSALDSVLWLLDSNLDVLDYNDDDGQTRDSYISYTLPADDDYYLVVGSYDEEGDRAYVYALTATLGTEPPAPPSPPPPPPPPPEAEKEWTAMLFLSGDNNLYPIYPRAIRNLEAILGEKASLVEVVVLLDGEESGDTARYVVQPDGQYTDNVNRWDMGELNMGDPQTLVDFSRWAMTNYPAEHYYLAVDNHGNGVYGISWDDSSEGDRITVKELHAAAKSITDNGQIKLDILAYEACLLGLYENVYDIREFADYLFAFESISWGSDATYSSYFEGLAPGMSAEQLGRRIVDQYTRLVGDSPHVSALLDVSAMDGVRRGVDNLATAMVSQVAPQKTALTLARSATQKFEANGNNLLDDGDPYLDLWDLARQVAARFPALATEADALQSAVEAAVIDGRVVSGWVQASTWDHSGAHGLGVYWPQTASGAYDSYVGDQIYTVTRDGTWDEFLKAYFGTADRGLPIDPGPVEKPSAVRTVFLPIVLRGY